MKQKTKWLVGLLALSCASIIGASATSRIVKAEEEPVEIPTIIDDCNAVEGANKVANDVYGYTLSTSDLGFGEDVRFVNRLNSTSAPAAWSNPYAHYNVSGHNVIKVVAAEAPEGKDILEPIFIYTNKGAVLDLYDMSVETAASTGWSHVTYTFVLEGNLLENTTYIRIVTSAYNDASIGLETWMQQISKVEISYMETLPEKTPTEEPPVDSSSEEVVDSSSEEVVDSSSEENVSERTEVLTDECLNNVITSPRKDVYNVSVRNENVAETGDKNRIVFGNHALAESYIEYKMDNMDTLVVTTYEPLNEDGSRPTNTTVIKFCIWKNDKCVAWEVAATKVEVVEGDAVSGRWTKVLWYYTFDETYESAVIRMVMYKPAEGQAEIEVGRVDVYNSATADFSKVEAREALREYAYAKDSTQYTAENWESLIGIMVEAVHDLYKAEDAAAVETIVTTAKADIDAVEQRGSDIPEDSSSEDEPVVVETITDNCDALTGGVLDDLYGFKLDTSDVGFGADSRYVTTKGPTEPISKDLMWDVNYAYVEYRVAGQNLLTVVADVQTDVLSKVPHIFVLASFSTKSQVIELNNYSVESSDNWSRVTYKFILPEGTIKVRVICGAYNAWDESVSTWQQQITQITIERVETLPEKDANIPTIDPAPEKPVPPPVSEEELAKVHTDNCVDNNKGGVRNDAYNVSIRADNLLAIGDATRMVYGDYAKAESYVDYKMDNMNTIAVISYEPILENNVRPASTTQIKFCIWQDGVCVAWEKPATRVEVELGDYESGRWTKVIWYYTFEQTYASAQVRVMLFKPAEGQAEIEVGRVDVYHSEYADFSRVEAQTALQEYAYGKDSSDYTAANWESVIRTMALAVEAINLAESDAEIEAIVETAKAEMDAIKTFSMEFEANKESKKLQISEFAVNKGKKNYSAENWNLIVAYAVDAQNKIDAATTEAEINTILAEAKELINGVKTLEEEKPPVDSSQGGSDSGDEEIDEEDPTNPMSCFSGIESAGMMLGMVAVAAVAMLKGKKEEDKE